MTGDAAYMAAVDLVVAYRKKALSPVEAVSCLLTRLDAVDARINAFCFRDDERVMAQARESEARWVRGEPAGLLDGVPVSIKDLVLTRGWPTRRGSHAIDPVGPWDEDAPSVARLREHGAILLGKTATPEFGWKGVTESPLTGITRNPWNPSRTPGGSSGGAAAAVAAGLGPVAVGTDGGGSIREPASFSGVVGLKPTFGRVPSYPYPLSPPSTLLHTGPVTRTVADAALLMAVIARPDPRDWWGLPDDGCDYRRAIDGGVAGLRIAYSPGLGGAWVDREVAGIVDRAARSFAGDLGASVESVDTRLPDPREAFALWRAAAAAQFESLSEAQRAVVDPQYAANAKRAARLTIGELAAAERRRQDVALALARIFETFDLLLTPTMPIAVFETGHDDPPGWYDRHDVDWDVFMRPFNLSRQPAISVPCGFTAEGLPVGLQIVGPLYADAAVLRAAQAYQRAHPLLERTPPL